MLALPRLAARLAWTIPLAALLTTACEHSPAAPGVLATITVTRNPDTLAVGTSRQFTAIGRDADGTAVGVNPTWSVAAGGGALNTSGVFTAGTTPGTFANTVTATLGSISGKATVTVLAGPVATITIAPATPTLVVGTTQLFTAVLKDAYGNVVATSPNWSVSAGGGSINSAGLFTAGPVAGTYLNTVVASVGSVTASATVTVIAGALATITVTPGTATLATTATQQFTAAGQDATGNPVSIAPIWSVAAGGGTINSSGLFTAGTTAGVFPNTVVATVGGIAGTASVTVTAGAPATITVSPTTSTLVVGTTQQFTAVVKDLAGNVLPTVPVWSVAGGGGTINSAGLFTAGASAGTFTNTVRATIGIVAGSASVTVTAGGLLTIVVTPNAASLAVGGTQLFTATGKDANGNTVAITPTWSIVASGGTINAAGLFTAGTTAGSYANTVMACSTALCGAGSVSGFATVTVNSGSLATITVTPNPIALGTGASQTFTAVGRDANGNVLPILPTPVWSVAVGYAGGTIQNPSGTYTAPGAPGIGFDSVRATIGAIAGSARVNVSAAGALVSIAVTPNPSTVFPGGTSQMTATGFDGTGLVVPTPGLVWSVVPAVGGGTINSGTGLFTAGSVAGTYQNAIKATSGSVSGFATVTVSTSPPPGPSLGTAATHGLLAGTAFTCVTGGTINADASVWPGSAFTGFPPCVITGATHAADAFAQQAQGDLTTAFQALAAMPCGTTITANLGGTTLAEGVYCSTTSVGVTGTVTLTGNANSVFVIRAASTLTTAGNVVLIGGAQAKNVYWWVGSSATIGTASQWQGNILALTSITLVDNATLVGRALARNGAVTLGTNNTITLP